MLKKILLAVLVSFLFVGIAGAYSFEDKIDNWGPLNLDAAYIGSNGLSYTHDITDDVDFGAGHYVTEAFLELDFTNDITDSHGSKFFGLIRWDYREFARVAWDGAAWTYLGEVDNGQYDMVVDVDWLNDNGMLDVTLNVRNPLGTADAWLDHSRLYGSAVPEPSTLLLLGAGVAGLAIYRRKKS